MKREGGDMAIKKWDEYIIIKKKHPFMYTEYDGDDDFDESVNEEIEFPVNKESVFEKHKRIDNETDK